MDLFNVFNNKRQGQSLPAINPQQFIQVVQTLDKTALERLVQIARAQGITDSDIQFGLNFINSLH